MASYNARGRDPLLDSTMQAAIEKRGKELIGIALIILGLMAAAMIGSYTPDDPNWMVSTDAPVQNWMGRIGASIAAPLFMIVGWGSWGLALVLIGWGVRFAGHWGEDRAVARLIFAPIWIAVVAIYASTLVPGLEWRNTHSFGLGGLFGDTVMGALLTLLPIGSHFMIKLMSLLMAVGMVSLAVFVLGFTRADVQKGLRFVIVGIIVCYGALMTLLGRGASATVEAARTRQAQRTERKEAERYAAEQAGLAEQAAYAAQAEAEANAVVEEPLYQEPRYEEPVRQETVQPAPEPVAQPEPKQGLLARMPSLIRRPEPMPEPELVEPAPIEGYNAMPGDDRIKAKIADAVRSRQRIDTPPEPQPDPTRPLTKGRGRGPDPLVLDTTSPASQLPPEPPMTGEVALPPEPPVMAPQVAPQVAMPAEPPVMTPQMPAEPAMTAAPTPRVTPQVSAPVAPRVVPQATVAPVVPSQLVPQPTITTPQPAPQATIAPVVPTDPAPQVPQPMTPMQQVAADPVPRPQPVPISAQIPVAEPRRAVVEQPVRKPTLPSRRAQAEEQPALAFEEKPDEFELPPLGLLANPMDIERHHLSDEALEENARMLENVLDDYGVKGEIVSVRPGPVVTMYELEPAPGLKASRVIGLADDIARSMSALSARVSTVPGRSVIGIELPNENREKVVLREILASRDFGDSNMSLPLALGKDIGGDSVVANLAKMPHLLIAGTTGSGKSVAINTMILSLLYKLTPDECRLIMIDPKMLELSVYDGIPHLLSPVVTDPKKAVVALKWTVGEMEDRYRKMSKMGVRNIEGYNGRVREALKKGEMFSRTVQTGFDDDTGEPVFETEEFAPEAMPFIVVIVDEMADLMMVAGKEIEACIQRLAQMARASGIHLIMATQRPSVDVITGTIKANFPTRISFQVTSKIDSRTILGEMGAEQLLGMGDMLYMAGGAKITRCHGPFVSDEEVEEIVNHLKAFGPPQYMSNVLDGPDEEKASNIDAVLGLGGNTDGEDALYDTAVAIVIKDRKCSTSYIQRKLAIGYNKAARLVEQMEDEGLVSPANHVGKREILVPEQQ